MEMLLTIWNKAHMIWIGMVNSVLAGFSGDMWECENFVISNFELSANDGY